MVTFQKIAVPVINLMFENKTKTRDDNPPQNDEEKITMYICRHMNTCNIVKTFFNIFKVTMT